VEITVVAYFKILLKIYMPGGTDENNIYRPGLPEKEAILVTTQPCQAVLCIQKQNFVNI
jgi:hypothetical protein